MMKRGQAAMEFLMTYGWAILVVLAAIGALAYFGVLSPDRFLPEKCVMPSGLACLDFKGTTTALSAVIQNSAGFDMSSVTVTVHGTSCTPASTTLSNGEKKTFTCSGTFTAGKLKTNATVAYTNAQTSMTYSKVGDFIVKVV